jgi:hypothetical protein
MLSHCLENRLTDGGEVVRRYAPAALYPPGRFLVLISVRCSVDPRAIVRLEGLGQLKNPIASSGIEPTTFRLVARYRVPLCVIKIVEMELANN